MAERLERLKMLRVAAVALRSEFGEPDANLDCILEWTDQAADAGAQLVCFPETALQGYCTIAETVHSQAEPVDGPRMVAIRERVEKLGITVSVGMALSQGGKIFNSQVFIGPDGFIGAQHKVHLCRADGAYEPGDEWNVIELCGWKIGATICFDSEFPEAARILALKGADLVLMSFASGRRDSLGAAAEPGDWHHEVLKYAPSRAYDNRVFVVGFNHAGQVADARGLAVANPQGLEGIEEWAPPGTIHRWPGYNFAIDPTGSVIAESDGSSHEPNMMVIDLAPEILKRTRSPIDVKWPGGWTSGDFSAVRRVDTFHELLQPDRRGKQPQKAGA